MTEKRLGPQTIRLPSAPSILGIGTVSGRKEYLGPIGKYVDVDADQTKLNLSSWEAEERSMLQRAINTVLTKTKMLESNIDYMLMGDLLNQIVTSSYTARENAIPFIGLYGACSTMALSLSVASMLIDGGFATNVIAATGSHFCTAERQYRYPLEMGVQRTASSQWTATGSAALVLSEHRQGLPSITHVTTGRVVDFGITDANNMGAAMAPAAISTLRAHFDETNRAPEYYDLILTGDLGMYGKSIVADELCDEFNEFSSRYTDCGCELFKGDTSVLAGGSGCGCSALYMGKVIKDFELGNVKRVLFVATGALHNPVLINQKESIPGIAHAVAIERE
ncbi:MAG: stage V sporulation protein AD [Clostridiales bacterium]|nr:stage V sporulation protein AD [Clostridiales bacterium]